ncbi:MAG TPA: hypothetical protein DD738_02900 [Ruminiclostridium sp.]|nr:hypothetical protein [Ruminiclostridium sp.]
MPFKMFDPSRLILKPLGERIHDIDLCKVLVPVDDSPASLDNEKIRSVAGAMVAAKKANAAILLMYGAHVIRSGCSACMIELMRRGLVTHLATNGAGSIHDFEFSLIGKTCESVLKYVSEGQFGLWQETGILNHILEEGTEDGLGAGESIGRYIWENNLPYKESSVLGNAYHLGVPCTVHIGIGQDIIHEHPNVSGAALGEASYCDFLIYVQSITNLENGLFLNFGSQVTGPEVYLKALAMARNAAHQKGQQIKHFTTAVFDIQPVSEAGYNEAPPKTDPKYYFRPWKTILARTVADGGKSFYIRGLHRDTLPSLAKLAIAMEVC